MPAAVAVPAAISAGSSIFGGIMGSRAAKSAARIQQEEAQRQAQGFRDVLGEYNPQIRDTAERAATDVLGASDVASQRALEAARTGSEQVRADALAANALLDPYMQVGAEGAQSLREFMAGPGQKTFTAADMAAYDPGYKFRLDESARALQNSAAARGGALGGGALAALANRQQNLASAEFGAASDRFRQQQQDRYSRLFGATELGGRYAGQAGANLIGAGQFGANLGFQGAQYAGNAGMQGAQYAGNARTGAIGQMAHNAIGAQGSIADLMTGGAAAQAAGTVGSANAWSGMLGGIAGAANQAGRYYQDKETLRELMNYRNPAVNPSIGTLQSLPARANPWLNPSYAYWPSGYGAERINVDDYLKPSYE